MHLTDDVDRGAWLRDRLGAWATVAGAAGTGFERYARLLHPVGARRLDLTTTDAWGQHPVAEEAQWPWRELARRNGKTMHPLVQWQRITDEERALDFADGWGAEQSRDGWFDPALMARLTSSLRTHTAEPDDVTIGVWSGWGTPATYGWLVPEDGDAAAAAVEPVVAAQLRRQERAGGAPAFSPAFLRARERGPLLHLPGRDYVLLAAALTELADPDWGYGAGIGWDPRFDGDPSPQLVWSADRAWIVATEIDWDSTIVGGPAALIAEVLADPAFEAFEVAADADLSWSGDTINR
ncbi:hypothetical protein [Agrococcus sp. Marseille-P2731]|uniref:hypothetical protein n=1 Tax=Agrococcus sp. Marseille-P2731 TaxID=1841862 RepID=UPI0009312D17|nr:hypothetical protein [Agrococcus sp. Marseille-P2731]